MHIFSHPSRISQHTVCSSTFAPESVCFSFSHFHSTYTTKNIFPSPPEHTLCLSESCWNGTPLTFNTWLKAKAMAIKMTTKVQGSNTTHLLTQEGGKGRGRASMCSDVSAETGSRKTALFLSPKCLHSHALARRKAVSLYWGQERCRPFLLWRSARSKVILEKT